MSKYFVEFIIFKALGKTLGLAVIVMAAAALTQAQPPRTWVSGVGDDTFLAAERPPAKLSPERFLKRPLTARSIVSTRVRQPRPLRYNKGHRYLVRSALSVDQKRPWEY
jgi:hypothetical protein